MGDSYATAAKLPKLRQLWRCRNFPEIRLGETLEVREPGPAGGLGVLNHTSPYLQLGNYPMCSPSGLHTRQFKKQEGCLLPAWSLSEAGDRTSFQIMGSLKGGGDPGRSPLALPGWTNCLCSSLPRDWNMYAPGLGPIFYSQEMNVCTQPYSCIAILVPTSN